MIKILVENLTLCVIDMLGSGMIFMVIALISFYWGCTFTKWRSTSNKINILRYNNNVNQSSLVVHQPIELPQRNKKKYFCEFEIRFLNELLLNQFLTVSELNKILKIDKISSENQRQRRHIFLKELNLKLSLFLEIAEPICRKENKRDKREKIYCLDNTLKFEDLIKIFDK